MVKKGKINFFGAYSKRMVEVFFVFSLAFSLFTLLSLATYHIRDNFAFHGHDTVLNSGGFVGAWLSRALFILFGYSAYGLPLFVAYFGYTLLKKSDDITFSWQEVFVRAIGFLLIFLSLSGLFSLENPMLWQLLPVSSGGVTGSFVVKPLYQLFSFGGSLLFLTGGLLIGLTLLTDISWLRFVEKVGECTLRVLRFCLSKLKQLISFKERVTVLLSKVKAFHASRKERKSEKAVIKPVSSDPVLKRRKKKSKQTEELVDFDIEIPEQSFSFEKPTILRKPEKIKKRKVLPTSHSDIPSIALLSDPVQSAHAHFTTEELESRSREVEQRLLDFGIEVQVVAVHPGPVITRFELQLAPGLKVSKITSLGKDLARSLSVTSVRVVEVIPGKAVVGLELPNPSRDVVCLSEVLATHQFANAKSYISLALGVDIAGHPVIVDLAKMPHLLVAGTTGSGKSVGINAMLLSLILKATPEEVRLILVDPKMLELSIYEGIPHLLAPVVTDMKDAASALRWCVVEMERRYRLMASLGVRNIASFNHKVKEAESKGMPLNDPLIKPGEGMEPTRLTTLPKIVVVIDELADMMMVVGKKVEQLIARIAQKARASGIHLILATQRPSVDVLTGLIKSNIPTRISFQVSSKIDSRTILDQQGAEQLLGQGDMLYLAPGTGTPVRVHGAFVDDNEVHRVVNAWREVSEPDYMDEITTVHDENFDAVTGSHNDTEDSDPLYDEAVEFVVQSRKASISSVQRRFKIGYNRAARLVEEMERTGLVGPLEGGTREVLAPVRVED